MPDAPLTDADSADPERRLALALSLRTSGSVGRADVRAALNRLAADPDPAVREAASWWTSHWRYRAGRLKARLRPEGRRPAPHHNKVLSLEDFADPDVAGVIRTVFPHEVARFGPAYPAGAEYRKHWEIAMAVRALDRLGALRPDAVLLGVAAGNEPTIFHLTTRARQVFATDLYLDPGVWTEFADHSMLLSPEQHWPGEWDRRRLVAQHMDALELRYPDDTFDGIFSSSSIEHFGSLENMEQAVREMYRVLKPGGICTVSTEYRLEGPSPGLPGCLMLDPELIRRHIVGDLGWRLVDELDTTVTPATRAAVVDNDLYLKAWEDHFAAHGRAVWHELDLPGYPQVVLRNGEHVFTSVHLALRKD